MVRAHRSIPRLTKNDILRFWEKVRVRRPDECWPWCAYQERYGIFGLKRQLFKAHRIAFTLTKGPFPSEFCVCHTCDNPSCCNPAHLFLGSMKDNMVDAARKGRMEGGDKHWRHRNPEMVPRGEHCSWAKLTEDKVRIIRSRYRFGNVTQQALAREYGVSAPVISNIVSRKIWAHVP